MRSSPRTRLQDVESVLEYKRQIRSTQAYLDDSVLVNLDAMSIPTEKLTFRMSAGTGLPCAAAMMR